LFAVAVTSIVATAGLLATTTPSPAAAADLSQFRPGNIISDQVFFNSGSMGEAQVQAFLDWKNPGCRSGYVCLNRYTETTPSRSADSHCAAYAGASSESAARIITKVARACGINPQVLIVTLQKEQGLVTDTWPTSTQYRIAMGYACPDSAACDSQYYGFFNQVYSAARQFKVYGASSYFTWYAPGQVHNILYNPNRACGSTPVYIENQATANLYYYTPYQPNAAALAAGYGIGDSCSTYGNRNFYNYFTDWFGSTQVSSGSLVQASGSGAVYLLTQGVKHHIEKYADYAIFASRLGGVSTVPQSYLDAFPTGNVVTRYVHGATDRKLYLLQADGTKHNFPTVESTAALGYQFNEYTTLDQAQIDAFTTGAPVGSFVRLDSAPETYKLEAGTKRYIPNAASWFYVSAGTSGAVVEMDRDRATNIPDGPAVLPPNTLVRAANSGDVMMTTGNSSMIHITSFAMGYEFGARDYFVLPAGILDHQTTTPGDLGPFVSCGSSVYFASGGQVYSLSGALPTGWTAVPLASDACTFLVKSNRTITSPIFVQPAGSGAVYAVADGTLRHVRSYESLMSMNGSRPLTILAWSPETAAAVGIGAPYLEEGNIVQFSGKPEVYVWRSGSLHHIQDYAALLQLGGGQLPRIEQLPVSYLASYKVGDPL